MTISREELIAELEGLIAKTEKTTDLEVLAACVVVHTLLAALLSRTTESFAGSAAAFSQLSLADLRDKQ